MATLGSIYKYQYDETGVSPTNLITGETRTISAPDPTVFVPFEGLFFGSGVVISNGGTPLVLGIDYELEALDPFYTAATGKPVYAGIKRLSTAMLGTLSLTYQALGGPEGIANSFVMSLKAAIESAVANPTINWADIIGKPSAFTPAAHKHYPTDLEDLDLLAQKFDDFIDAIVSVRFYKDSNHSLHNEILRLTALVGSLRNSINSIATVAGGAQDIINIQDRLDNISKEVKSTATVANGVASQLYRVPLTDFSGLGLTVLITDGSSRTTVINMNVAKTTSNVVVTFQDCIIEGAEFVDLNSSNWLVSDTGGNFTLTVTTNANASIKIKERFII